MTQEQLKVFLTERTTQLRELNQLFDSFVELDGIIDVSVEAFKNVEIKYNNRYYFLKRSIHDHEKLLK